MSTLIAWELGSGLGHVGPLRAIATELVRRGELVTLAAPNVALCQQAFAGTGVTVRSAPALPLSEQVLKFPCTYTDILHDCGYSSADNLATAVDGWLAIFEEVCPQRLLADHSPTALLASRIHPMKTAALGTGFLCPPNISPLPSLRLEIPAPHWAADVEQTVLDNLNQVLCAHDSKPLERVAELFAPPVEQYLLTFEPLDHYREWRSADPRPLRYWPPVGTLPGDRCDWPVGSSAIDSPKVFVYLRNNEVLTPVLRGLAYKKICTIAYAPHFTAGHMADFQGTSVTVCTNPIDLPTIGPTCDAAVLHGGHGAVCALLRHGVPQLLLPLMLEQQITANRLEDLGVGIHAPLEDLNSIATGLEKLLETPSCRELAAELARTLPQYDEQTAVSELVDDLVFSFAERRPKIVDPVVTPSVQ